MQKRPKYVYNYSPIGLSEDFPLVVSKNDIQTDRPIRHLHSHDATELGLCLRGTGIFVVNDKVMTFSEGDVILITNKEMHLAQSTHGTTSEWVWIYFNLEKLLFPVFGNSKLAGITNLYGKDFKNIINRDQSLYLNLKMQELIDTCRGNDTFRKEKILSFLCLIIAEFHKLNPNNNGKESIAEFDIDTMERLHKGIAFITSNYRKKITLKNIEKICSISTTHLKRLFSKNLGKSPIQFLNKIRIAAASADLLHSSKPVTKIAMECGFQTISSFNRQFKKQTGMSPRDWRNSKNQFEV